MTAPRTVLLTGASGVVGRSLLRTAATGVAAAADLRFVAGVHRGPVPEATGPTVHCDVSAERFGLDEDSYAALADDVDEVVHSAGLTEWGLPIDRYEPVNVAGTRRVAEFAERAGAPVHFISTAFVAALAPDAPVPLGAANVCRNYITSKAAAERLLRERGLPHTVFRPTNLVGESGTGWTAQGQIVQMMSDWLARGRAPFVPAHPGVRMDFVAQDLLSLAVLGALAQGDTSGEFWVTYGPEAMDVDGCLRVLAGHVASRGSTLALPPVVDPDGLEGAIEALPGRARSFMAVLRDVSEVTRCSGGVLPTSMPLLRERYGVPYVDDTEAYLASLEYAAEHLA